MRDWCAQRGATPDGLRHAVCLTAGMDPTHAPSPADRFDRLYAAAHGPVARALAGRAASRDELDDALQQAAVTAWRRFAAYDGSRPFAAWLHGIARRTLAQRRRGAARRPPTLPLAAAGALPARTADDGDLEIVETRLGRLDRGDRRLLTLRYRDGLSLEELAACSACSPAAVATRLSRLLARLRERSR